MLKLGRYQPQKIQSSYLKGKNQTDKIIVINQICHMLPHSRTGLAPAPLAVVPAHISFSPPPQAGRLEQATRVMSP